MILNKEVEIATPLWNNRHPGNSGEKYLAHRLPKPADSTSSNNVPTEARNLSKDIFYLSVLFYLTGVTALVYLVINS